MAEEDSRQELIEYFCSLSFVHETEDGPSDETRSVSLCVRACVCVRVRAWVRGCVWCVWVSSVSLAHSHFSLSLTLCPSQPA
jgi:hypothetical protein